MTQVFESPEVKHNAGCCSMDCLLNKEIPHFAVYYFQSSTVTYYGQTLHNAAMLWIKDGCKPLLNTGRIG